MHIHKGAPAQWRASLAAVKRPASVVAIGNFDGVHLGHRALIGEAVRRAETAADREAAVLTFEPHPRSIFRPDDAPFRLSPANLKARRIASLGVRRLFVADFAPSLFGLSAEQFARDVLKGALNAACVVTGEDFRFGSGRSGDVETLRAFGAALGFEAVTVAPVRGEGSSSEIYSSTSARQALRDGRPIDAARILGDWHRIEGRVEKGDQRGRHLGFPTANLSFGDALRPAFGVYAAQVEIRDGAFAGRYDGVASIGLRPTFDATVENFEVHLFDFDGDIYGAEISAELRAFLRPELKFDDVNALIKQMRIDSQEAKTALMSNPSPWRVD
ncbi:MAG: bifunctional riboflavin kinase/FAD synthetase [Neomegalonema sp.]|nr:bifunctional riboflavin kinase/FAD synthetase [Neomegalonema sp.]